MKHPVLPCVCGQMPVLCYHDYLSCYEGTFGASVYDTTRYYRYICPDCKEWGIDHESPSIAKRFWNELRRGTRKYYYHKADGLTVWRNTGTNEIVVGELPSNHNCWGNF